MCLEIRCSSKEYTTARELVLGYATVPRFFELYTDGLRDKLARKAHSRRHALDSGHVDSFGRVGSGGGAPAQPSRARRRPRWQRTTRQRPASAPTARASYRAVAARRLWSRDRGEWGGSRRLGESWLRRGRGAHDGVLCRHTEVQTSSLDEAANVRVAVRRGRSVSAAVGRGRRGAAPTAVPQRWPAQSQTNMTQPGFDAGNVVIHLHPSAGAPRA